MFSRIDLVYDYSAPVLVRKEQEYKKPRHNCER